MVRTRRLCSCYEDFALVMKTGSSVKPFAVKFDIQYLQLQYVSHYRILKYTTQHAHDDALVVGVPQSENPFKDAKGCLIL